MTTIDRPDGCTCLIRPGDNTVCLVHSRSRVDVLAAREVALLDALALLCQEFSSVVRRYSAKPMTGERVTGGDPTNFRAYRDALRILAP